MAGHGRRAAEARGPAARALARARHARGCPPASSGLGVGELANLGKLQNFANFWRARSRLYQSEFLQENMRLTAFFKLYKICITFAPLYLKILAKTRVEKSATPAKFQQNFANVAKSAKVCKISKISDR